MTGRAQERDEQISVRTALARDISASLAEAIGTAGLAARGDVQEPTHRRALVAWTTARSRIAAELGGRFPNDDIVRQWRSYGRAVDAYVRLGGVSTDREAQVGYLSAYAREAGVDWAHLAPASGLTSGPQFQAEYERLGAWLVRRGGELVKLVLSLDPDV